MTMNKMQHKETLCWSCGNAVPDRYGHGCSWSEHFVPVDGWVAKKVIKSATLYSTYGGETYRVFTCPEYIEDIELNGDWMGDDEEAVIRLANQVIKCLADDYMAELRKKKRREKTRTLKKLLSKEYRMCYPKQAKNLYGRIYTDEEERNNEAKLVSLERNFRTEHIRALCMGDPIYIMETCREVCGFEAEG